MTRRGTYYRDPRTGRGVRVVYEHDRPVALVQGLPVAARSLAALPRSMRHLPMRGVGKP